MYNKNDSNFILCNSQHVKRKSLPAKSKFRIKPKSNNACSDLRYPFLKKDFQITNLIYKKKDRKIGQQRLMPTMPKEISLTMTNFSQRRQLSYPEMLCIKKLMHLTFNHKLPVIMISYPNRIDVSAKRTISKPCFNHI